MYDILKILGLFTVCLVLIFCTTLLFEIAIIKAHLSRKILVWILLVVELLITYQVLRIEIKKL